MRLTAAQKALIRQIQKLHAHRVALNISAVKRAHPQLIEQVYAVRPFWGWKRALEEAGLSYSMINIELCDYVKCKICGGDLAALSLHLASQHQMTTEDFRAEYPEAEMVCETIRAATRQRHLRRQPLLAHWEAIWTPEYVLDRMAELYRLKVPMNIGWASRHEPALSRKVLHFFGAWDEALRRLDLDPARIRLANRPFRGWSRWRNADKAAIVTELRRGLAPGRRCRAKKS